MVKMTKMNSVRNWLLKSSGKLTISLCISPAALKKAKQYGKGYTGMLIRLLDAAIDDEDLVRKQWMHSCKKHWG